MRIHVIASLLALCLLSLPVLFASPVQAQTAPPAASPLAITIPAGAKIDTEFDGKESDLLGMVKDLLSGMSGSGEAKGNAGGSPLDMFLGPNAEVSLTSLLKNVQHLHLVIYSLPEGSGADSSLKEVKEDVLGFYSRAFQSESGRRLLYNASKDKILIYGFDQPRGIAVVVGQKDKVTVVRTVGYPDMKVAGNIIRRFTGSGAVEEMPPVASASAAPAKAAIKPQTKPVAKRKTRNN